MKMYCPLTTYNQILPKKAPFGIEEKERILRQIGEKQISCLGLVLS
jgi:hypothetical protein